MKIGKFIIAALAVCFIGTVQGQTVSPTEQVLQTRTFEQGLVWTGNQSPGDTESQELLTVLSHANEPGWTTNVENFFIGHPQSPWSASLHHDYALYCRQLGRTSKALEQWQMAWDLVKDDGSPAAKKLAGSIVANWTDLLSSLGRLDKLKELIAVGNNLQFASPHDRDLFQGARNAYYLMKAHPAIAYRCGTFALKAVGEKLGIGENFEQLVGLRSPTNGFNMEQLVEIGKQHGLDMVAVHRPLQAATNGQELVVPSVVHWRANHYAAILEKQGDRYLVSDPTFGNQRYLTADVINEEASGDFLIPAKTLPGGWTEIATNEIASIHGMGLLNNIKDANDKGNGLPKPPCGMPVWWVSEPYVNLWMADEPISYLTSRGEPMTLRLSFKQRDSARPSPSDDSVVGNPGWNNSWFSYIALSDPATPSCIGGCMPTGLNQCSAAVYLPDGGEVDFAQNQSYDQETRLLLQQQTPGFSLAKGSDQGNNGLRLVHADGSQDIYGYGLSDAHQLGYIRAFFLRTKHIDPHGNVTQFNWAEVNSVAVVQSVVDYDGKTNTLSYVGVQGVAQLWAVTNAYGLNIHIKYDASGNLTNIVDAIGMSSSFTYDTNNNPTSLVTPYGTTRFSVTDNGITYGGGGYGNAGGDATGLIDRSALIVDPTGATNLYMYRYDSGDVLTATNFTGVPTNTPLGTLDTGSGDTNTDLGLNAVYFRNSYHWNPRQYAALSTGNMTSFTANDYLLARTRHWLQDTNDQYVTGYLSVERDPSPDGSTEGLKFFYDYQGKSLSYRAGTNAIPSVTAWCLPGGETHYEYKQLDSFGNVTNDITTYTKPGGTLGTRTNQFIYASNTYTNMFGGTSGGGIVFAKTNTFTVPDLLTQVIGPDGNPIWTYGGFDSLATTNYYPINSTQSNAVKFVWARVLPDYATNGLNQVATVTYDGFDKLSSYTSFAGLTTTNIYNANGFLAQRIDLQIGRTNSFGFGANGLPIAFTNELGLNLALTWDNLLRPTSTLFPDGTYTSNRWDRLDLGGVRDRLTNWTSYIHDGARHLTVITNANSAVTLLSWCGCGALTGILDPLNHLTTLNEDLQGNVTNIVFPDYSTLNYTYDLAQRPTKLSDGAGRFLKLGYNNQNLVTTVSNANGTVQSATFDIKDRAITATDANHVTLTNTFDNLDQILTRTWPDGIGEGYGYTAQGLAFYTNRDQQVTLYGRNTAGWLMAVTNANGEVNQVTRDPAGDILTLLDGLNHQTQWQLNQYGWVTNKQDALGRNAFQYAYNPNGWVTNRTTPEKGNTGFARDNVGNVIRTIYPQLTITNAYDALNELTNMVDAAGSHNFAWTPAGQLQSEGDAWTTVSNNYSQGLRTLLSIAQSGTNWTQSYVYDAGWRMTNTTSLAGGFIYQFQSALMNKPSSILLPNGAYITNSFDSLANLKSTALVNHWGHILDGYTYAADPLGLRTNITRNFGLTTNLVSVGNDKIGQLTSWTASESGGQPRYNEQLGWKYDAADNLLQRTNNLLVQSFTVDAANELTNITRSGAYTLAGATPAPASSILVNGQNAQTYGDFTFARTNLTLVNGSNTFSIVGLNLYNVRVTNLANYYLPTVNPLGYDKNGNLTNDGTKTYSWDAENQMTNVTLAGAWKKDFVFDGLNRLRIKKEFNWNGSSWTQTNELRFIWDGNAIVQIRNSNNVPILTLTRGLDLSGTLQGAGGIGGLLAMTDGNGANYFYHNDAAGNVTALMDGYENIVGRRTYGAFGNSIFLGGSKASVNPFWHASQLEVTPELYLYQRRPRSTTLPGWLSQDPAGLSGGINAYGFAHNNPINWIDPLGLWGVQFGNVNIGRGNPNYAFNNSSWNDVANGAAAVADGLLPQPYFQDLYQNGDPFDPNSDSYSPDYANALDAANSVGWAIATPLKGDKPKGKDCPPSNATRPMLGSLDQMSNSGQSPDRGGLTKAGRSLTKHGAGARPGNSAFPPATGNPQQINQTAQNILDDILTDPNTTSTPGYRGRFGTTTEFMGPNGQGAVFDAPGNFLFFIE